MRLAVVCLPMSHFRHTSATDRRAGDGYAVCRGPGDPLGAVAGAGARA